MPPVNAFRSLALAAACALALSAQAQWQWLDKDGRKVFSDRPPPADVPDKAIVKRPGKPVAAAPAAADAPPPGAGGTDEAAKRPADPAKAADPAQAKKPAPPSDLELKKKQQAEAEAARRKADEDRAAKGRAENCASARANMRTLESGVRMSRMNAAGEREAFDDKIRGEEKARLQGIIAQECQT